MLITTPEVPVSVPMRLKTNVGVFGSMASSRWAFDEFGHLRALAGSETASPRFETLIKVKHTHVLDSHKETEPPVPFPGLLTRTQWWRQSSSIARHHEAQFSLLNAAVSWSPFATYAPTSLSYTFTSDSYSCKL